MLVIICFAIVGALVGLVQGSDGDAILVKAIGYGFAGIIPGAIFGSIKVWKYL